MIIVGESIIPADEETSESINLFLKSIEIQYLSSNEECEFSS